MTKINERGGETVVARNLGNQVDSPFFTEAAEVEGHAGLGEKHVARGSLDFFPTDEALCGRDLLIRGQPR